MMAAMMLPTVVPTLRSYDDLIHSANGTRAGWIGVLTGYFLVWVGFAAAIAGLQLALLFGGAVDMLGIAKSPYLAGGLLIAVGAFQFTRVKEACHGVCHSPMTYFLSHWKTGFTAACAWVWGWVRFALVAAGALWRLGSWAAS